jgi:hypothetical protein
MFITHRDTHKRAAKCLAIALEPHGISAFVAHDTIKPMEDWKKEILKGLETMEVMLVFLTDDFHGSTWTNQEVGYALGRGTPIITLKLERADPQGFIGSEQALRARLSDPEESVEVICGLLATRVGQQDRLQRAFIAAFVAAPDFNEARDRFNRMDKFVSKLSDEEAEEIVAGFNKNDQLHNAMYLTNSYGRMVGFLNRTTGRTYELGKDRSLTRKKRSVVSTMDDDIPF